MKHNDRNSLLVHQRALATCNDALVVPNSIGWRLMRHLTVLLAAFLFGFAGVQATHGDPGTQIQATGAAQVPLYHNLGALHYPITTSVPLAQRYFDQGLRLY